MAELWLPERDGVIILDREKKGGKRERGRVVGLQRDGVEEKNLKVSFFIKSVYCKSL